jgi:hypothetical protein
LNSALGIELRKRRGPEIETFFGDLRRNNKFNRFYLRGLDKVTHELGLLAIGYNLRKIAAKMLTEAMSKIIFIYEKLKKALFTANLTNFSSYPSFLT